MENTSIDTAYENIRRRPIRMAICYDFDKTLSPDDMQTFTIIPSLGMKKEDFWRHSNTLAKENLMDNNLAWMYELISRSKVERQPIKKEYFNAIGKKVPLYKGVKEWFDRVNEYGKRQGIEIEHYIISSGLKEIIEGSVIATKCKRIYASSYLYSVDGIAEWPAQAVNYTNKTQYIFRIAKGIFEEWDESVNNTMADEKLYIPYENFVYIGDSATDIPCMRLVKSKGGYSIGVYDPEKGIKEKVLQLYADGRISFYAPANYCARSKLMEYMKEIIDEVAAKERIKTERIIMKQSSDLYKLTTQMNYLIEKYPSLISAKDRKEIEKEINKVKGFLKEN
ncbi:MAG: haloacid dehalogenase-like hydrolase [Acetatifactor sp.]|nr:haloacid dehalogenase-like hydrolase [Acetatifactor sp.]